MSVVFPKGLKISRVQCKQLLQHLFKIGIGDLSSTKLYKTNTGVCVCVCVCIFICVNILFIFLEKKEVEVKKQSTM